MRIHVIGILLGLLAGACASGPVQRLEPGTPAADAPRVTSLAEGGGEIELSVLIYNVEGLPWPARKGRGRKLDRIGEALARLRAEGRGPDIVMLQEAFTDRAGAIGPAADYPYIAAGPAAADRRETPAADIPRDFIRARRFFKGERFFRVFGAGLYIYSKFPIVRVETDPFSRYACAGLDCLANKGVLLVSIDIPGAPTPLDLFTTHMNAQRASRVGVERRDAAHRYQTDESARFLSAHRDDRHPLIFGGDFNMRNADARLEYFVYREPYNIVRHYCTVLTDDCDIRMSWDGDAPWLDTQDLQGFEDGAQITVRPVRAEALFDKRENGGVLADHDGYLVTYRLRWPAPRAATANGRREIGSGE